MCMNVSVFDFYEHARQLSAHTHTHTHLEICRTPLSCGGAECDADSLSLRVQSIIHTNTTLVCVYIYISYLFDFFSHFTRQLSV
jgi:hypothetical protein